ncbi:hypothetical protein ATCC90586_008658 [Pythium insidiosum]|nr:hypothetical protein ATCC90586_008658 [Pythium insidiosum]
MSTSPLPDCRDDDYDEDEALIATANAILKAQDGVNDVREVRDLASSRVWRDVFARFSDDEEADALRCLRWLQATVDANQTNARMPNIERDPECLTMAARHGWLDVIKFLRTECHIDGHLQRAMDKAAQYGHLDVVKYFHNASEQGCSYEAMAEAAFRGHLHVVQYLYETVGRRDVDLALSWAASGGRLEVLQYFHAVGIEEGWRSELLTNAANFGHLHVVRWIRENRPDIASERTILDCAASHGLELVRYLTDHAMGGATTVALDKAAEAGALDVVRYLHEHRDEGCTTAAMDRAAGRGHIDVVMFLHASRSEGCTTLAMDDAARGGHLEVVRFLHENRTEGCTPAALEGAVTDGHLDVVRFLVEERKEPVAPETVVSAAAFGHLEILRFLCAASGTSANEVFTASRMSEIMRCRGRVDIIRFVHEELGVELPPRSLVASIEWSPHLVLFEYILDRLGTEAHEKQLIAALAIAAARGWTDVLSLIDRKANWNDTTIDASRAIKSAAESGHLGAVQFFHERGYFSGWTAAVMDAAATNGHLRTVKFLHRHRREGCTTDAIDGAAANGFADVVAFLLQRRTEGYTQRALDAAHKRKDPAMLALLPDYRVPRRSGSKM